MTYSSLSERAKIANIMNPCYSLLEEIQNNIFCHLLILKSFIMNVGNIFIAQNLYHDARTSVATCISSYLWVNTPRPRQNGRRFAGDTFKRTFLTEKFVILNTISLKFVPKGPINDIPALVQIMAWRRPGDKLLSEPMAVRLLTHICVTRPQWIN